jgi:hypothetical protein
MVKLKITPLAIFMWKIIGPTHLLWHGFPSSKKSGLNRNQVSGWLTYLLDLPWNLGSGRSSDLKKRN